VRPFAPQAGAHDETVLAVLLHDIPHLFRFDDAVPGNSATAGFTRCKLQMMRTHPQPDGWRLGPTLAGGLTLRFYPSFRIPPSLPRLAARISATMHEYERWGSM
jgi:hypothetical protein